ncbi:MAG: hypothetical protein QF660_04685 [Anaerolineales bacterium]|nr:hypothetical protein [Anaerolineales bacterium]
MSPVARALPLPDAGMTMLPPQQRKWPLLASSLLFPVALVQRWRHYPVLDFTDRNLQRCATSRAVVTALGHALCSGDFSLQAKLQ